MPYECDVILEWSIILIFFPRSMKNRQEPENLLILTRTRTDRHGRRHSVAVPLIPPPDGEKFEGGYHVERNPITGGATLVPPEGKKGTCLDQWGQFHQHFTHSYHENRSQKCKKENVGEIDPRRL